MSDKKVTLEEFLKLGPNVKVKKGESFNKNRRLAYHTIQYDFRPENLDVEREGFVDAGPGSHMTITIPNKMDSASSHTFFKGTQKHYSEREYLVVYNSETNELILEKLDQNIQVKWTGNKHQQEYLEELENSVAENQRAVAANAAASAASVKVEPRDQLQLPNLGALERIIPQLVKEAPPQIFVPPHQEKPLEPVQTSEKPVIAIKKEKEEQVAEVPSTDEGDTSSSCSALSETESASSDANNNP